MQLSPRARKYINSLRRDAEYTASAEEHADYLCKIGVPVFIRIVEIGAKYGGLLLTLPKKESSNFKADLFPRQQMQNGQQADWIYIEGIAWFFFGNHQTAQIWFVLSEMGELGTYDNHTSKVYPIFSAFEKMIEEYAVLNEIKSSWFSQDTDPYFHELKDPILLQKKWKQYMVYPEASDNYNSWYKIGGNIIQTGRVYLTDTYWLRVHGKVSAECQRKMIELQSL